MFRGNTAAKINGFANKSGVIHNIPGYNSAVG